MRGGGIVLPVIEEGSRAEEIPQAQAAHQQLPLLTWTRPERRTPRLCWNWWGA